MHKYLLSISNYHLCKQCILELEFYLEFICYLIVLLRNQAETLPLSKENRCGSINTQLYEHRFSPVWRLFPGMWCNHSSEGEVRKGAGKGYCHTRLIPLLHLPKAPWSPRPWPPGDTEPHPNSCKHTSRSVTPLMCTFFYLISTTPWETPPPSLLFHSPRGNHLNALMR